MNCNPAPVYTCGSTIPDACVVITGNLLPFCDPDGGCYRQSEFNDAAATEFCGIRTTLGAIGTCAGVAGSGILGSIYLGCLTPCTAFTFPAFPISVPDPVKTAVRAELQQIYGELCKVEGVLNNLGEIPLTVFNNTDDPFVVPACLAGGPCCTDTPTTLRGLLEAMMAKICCITSTAVNASNQVLDAPGAEPGCPNCIS